MNYAVIKNYDIANGLGVRVSLFVSGCSHHCKGCFNEIAWDFNYGNEFTKKVEDEIIEMCRPSYIRGLSLLGGEPFEASNQHALVELLKRFRKEFPSKDVWCYTGYLYENILDETYRIHTDVTEEMLSLIDVLVDGKFEIEKKDISLKFKGSSNQRIIDVKKTLQENKIINYFND